MFEYEAQALKLLAGSVNVPQVLEVGEHDGFSFLLLQFIAVGPASSAALAGLGRQLGQLHKNTAPAFGLDYDNYLGSLKQLNTWQQNWAEFFTEMRLRPQLKLACDKGKLDNNDVKKFERLFSRIPQLFPVTRPALLHGDLWSGNYLAGSNQTIYFVDPAIYYGNREMDLAMTRLFGSFSKTFYQAYNEVYPLDEGFEERIDLCNLYPLLAHVNLFGGSYAGQLRSCLAKYI